jgi:hypothetical protein
VTDQELARAAARRLAIIRHAQDVTGNVALTCRYLIVVMWGSDTRTQFSSFMNATPMMSPDPSLRDGPVSPEL